MELWEDDDSHTVWERDPETGRFAPVSRLGRPFVARWSRGEIGLALGCPSESESRLAGSEGNLLPPSFLYSPTTGKKLHPAKTFLESWLPPCGSELNSVGLLRGGKLTRRPFRLVERDHWPADADVEIPLPPPGGRCFLVAACGLCRSFLFSLDAQNGCIYCWIPSAGEWAELLPPSLESAPYLGVSARLLECWRPEVRDIEGQTRIFWPCNSGIVALRLDPLTLTYFPELLAEGKCVAPLLPNNGSIFGLLDRAESDGLSLVGGTAEGQGMEELLSGIPESDWCAAVATPHDSIWISRIGQIVVNVRSRLRAFYPWPEEAGTPVFEFGPPYCSEKGDGRLWQQMLIDDGTEEGCGYTYASLGAADCDLHAATGARHHTGRSSIKAEQRLSSPPWEDPERVHFEAYENDEAVVPLLESVAGDDLLVLRADHLSSAAEFFEREEAIPTRFQIFRQQPDNKGFHAAKIHKPWETQVFIFDGRLFLYHPEMKSLLGWTIQESSK